jgi:hypothetical protein
MYCQDPVIERFLLLQSPIVQELLPAYAHIERDGAKIIVTFSSERWKNFFQRHHFPFKPGTDLNLSFEFRVRNTSPIHLSQKILA